MPITRAQSWSNIAYKRLHEVRLGTVEVKGGALRTAKYKTSCNKMPGLIHQSGALQALVFQVARDREGTVYVDHLAQAYFGEAAKKGHEALIKHAQSLELTPYMAFTRDLADIAQWFRRFSQIELANEVEEE
jgi:hypothetical protein